MTVTALEQRGADVTRIMDSTAARSGARPVNPRTGQPAGVRQAVGAYVSLMKLRVVELLLVTTLPAMVLAERGIPELWLVAVTLLGGTLAAGSAHAFNQVLERDIDAVMHRTRRRPVAMAVVSPVAAFSFASVLLVLAVVMMAVWVNPLAAALTAGANLFYVFIYTVLLKRRTTQNIVWGGVAGCLPTLIGWAAVTGSLDWPPVLLFLIVFFWTPPHYWPLAMRYRDDYERAGVPMLPVVAPARTVAAQILAYSWAMVATSLVLWPVGGLGWVYGLGAVVAAVWFLLEAHQLYGRARRDPTDAGLKAMRLFHGSITYLTITFVAVMADVLILG
ncbi:heme o synthase [Phytoactinopolyspora halotolerans]|uniref:Protoheme IX farnesyltransferase n=1 Tax=Phytoactinopolyspora halotolerans TaxID=1981512 RepID=A0A6L9SC88_9ACTN|nr:heme o synthase [Phytoactinopolyspora halotolerans]NEE02168.1 protoheme IX farnesyltransferase [Phytoactinopolyspora halotolerans]